MTLPADLKAKVLASVQAKPAPKRAPWWQVVLWIVPMSMAVAFSLFTAMGGMQHGEGRPTWMLIGTFCTEAARRVAAGDAVLKCS